MISLGMQGQIKPKDQVHALHTYINELHAVTPKPLLIGTLQTLTKCQTCTPSECVHAFGAVDQLSIKY